MIYVLDYAYGRYKSVLDTLSTFAFINISQYIIYIVYFIWRMANLDHTALPNDPNNIENQLENMRLEIVVSVVNCYIIFGMIIKIMDIIIFIDAFQNIVSLVQ